MTALQDKLDEQARIRAELQRMEDDDSVTEETDGDLRDTLVARWKRLDEECKPIIARMQEIQAITRTASNPANLERPDDGADSNGWNGGSPDLVVRTRRDPYDNNEAVRAKIVMRGELRERALDAVELEAKRGNLPHDFAEQATRLAQDNPGIARHMLLTGSEDYQETFRAYIEDPEGMAQRAALTLTLANGGYLLPFVLDQKVA